MAAQLGEIRDVVIVGGGAAALSAAVTLDRARRAVAVVDAGASWPRGWSPAPHPSPGSASSRFRTRPGRSSNPTRFGKTAIPGVWAAGNASDISAQVSGAIAEGARAGQHINADLSRKDLDRAVAARATTAGNEGDVR